MVGMIRDEKEIAAAQVTFAEALKKAATKTLTCKVGHQGESYDMEVHWNAATGLWVAFNKLDNRYWNAFGLAKTAPSTSSSLPIVVEINFPLKGYDINIGGALGTDDSGTLWVCHNGKIGGGKVGVSKELFWNNYSGEVGPGWYGTSHTKVALISPLSSPDLPTPVAVFVKEVDRIKRLAS